VPESEAAQDSDYLRALTEERKIGRT